MRGKDEQQLDVFSYISPEQRVPRDHPLRLLRAMTDEALQQLQPREGKTGDGKTGDGENRGRGKPGTGKTGDRRDVHQFQN